MTTSILPAGNRRCDSLDVSIGVDFRAGVRSSRVEFKEGIKAKRIVVSSVTARVKPSTRASGCRSRWMLGGPDRSEEHTSELQSLTNLVCRLLLEKKKKT